MTLFEIYFQNKNEFQNMRLTLDSIDKALSDVCFNQKKLGRILHVAGTNGKGSSSFFLAQMLEKNGFKTALFTSPHILDIKERFSVSLKNIAETDFNHIFEKHRTIIEKYDLSFFETSFFIAALWFSLQKPDVTILETGLGGRLDATNTNLIDEKICLITSISQDHAQILGSNVYKIADEKIKIARPSSPIFLGVNKESIKKYIKESMPNVIYETSATSFAKLNYPYPYSENYSLSHAVFEYFMGKKMPDYSNLKLPQCRLEEIGNVILDGSHNPAGVIALEKSGRLENVKTIIFSSTTDRDPQTILNILKQIHADIIFTSVPGNPRMMTEAPTNLDCKTILEPEVAFAEGKKSGGKILVTGSFFLCAYLKRKLQAGSL